MWDAAIAAGATLADLFTLDQGEYPTEFLAKIIAWHRGKTSIENHMEVAKAEAIRKKNKK